MKILQINANWGGGGPGGVVADLYSVINKSGNECVVAYGRSKIPDNIESIKIGTKLDVYFHAFSARIFDNAGFLSISATQEFIKRIAKVKPDIIHLHNLLGYYINIPVLFSYLRKAEIPIVWTLHDCWAFTGHCINFDRIKCDKWKTGCGLCKLKKDYPKSLVFDRSKFNLKRKIDLTSRINNMTLVTPSDWLSDLVGKTYLSGFPIRKINNGINLDVFKPTDSNLRIKYKLENKKILLFVASQWTEMKGEKIIYKLLDNFDRNYAFVMIGNKSSKNIPAEIINISHTKDIGELVEWYSTADIFVNPTLGDNFPTVNIEALACGTPVITFDTGGSAEIAGNECGKAVPFGDVQSMVNSIGLFSEARIVSSAKCVKHSKKYNKYNCFEEYIRLYESLLL